MEIRFLRKEDRKTHIWFFWKKNGGWGDVAQSRHRRETPSLESARDSKQQVLLFPTWFTSWLCTLSQESAVHQHLHFPKILLPPTCLLRNNSCLAEPPGAMLQNRGTYRSQTSSPPPPPLLFLSTARPVFHSSRPPSSFWSSKYHLGATSRTFLAMLRGFLAGYGPQHTPPMGFVLFLRGFSHRDTQPSRPPSSSHPESKAPVPALPLPHPGTITQRMILPQKPQ